MKPQIVFKYRSLKTKKEIKFFFDIIQNNRLFFPTYDSLNDPIEGCGYNINVSGCAGSGIRKALELEDQYIKDLKSDYRILSLSSDCYSPQLWAHYADNYSGVCIGFWVQDNIDHIKEVKYISSKVGSDEILDSAPIIQDRVRHSFTYKESGWEYEKEWRIICNKKSNPYLYFKPSNFACVIFGKNAPEKVKRKAIKLISDKKKIFVAYPAMRTFRIHLLENDQPPKFDGSTPQFVNNTEQLIKKLKR